MRTEIQQKPLETLELMLPSALYTVQNNMLLIGASHLQAAVFHVASQTKLFMVAVLSVFMLQRKIASTQWLSLFLLMVGVILVQYYEFHDKSNQSTEGQHPLYGLLATLFGCLCTSFAGVYFERIVKGSRTSLWIRNIQLGLGGMAFGLFGVMTSDGSNIINHGFFYGYNWATIAVILTNAAGGLVIAVVIKYADNVVKGFATGLSVVLSSLASIYIFDFHISIPFAIGTCLVVLSIILYSKPPASPPPVEKPKMVLPEDDRP